MSLRIDTFIIGILLVGTMITMGSLVLVDVQTSYGLNLTTNEYNSTYDPFNKTYAISEGMREDVFEADIESGLTTWDSMWKGTVSAIRLITASFSLVFGMAGSVQQTIGLPTQFLTLFIIGMSVMVVFAVIYLVFRVSYK